MILDPAEHHTDPETLREVLHRPGELATWLDRELAVGSEDHLAIGVAARRLGRWELAGEHLRRCGTIAGRIQSAVLLRARGRPDQALAALTRCREEAEESLDDRTAASVAHHTGECHYDLGAWARAGECFATAVRRCAELPESRLAADSAHACLAARAVAVELDRLVPAVQYRAAPVGSGLYRRHRAPPAATVLIELRTLLRAGPVPLEVVGGIYRHYPPLDAALDELVAAGWLERADGALWASGPCPVLLTDLRRTMDSAAEAAWDGHPALPALAGALDAVVHTAVGSSPGPVFDAWVAAGGDGTPAAVLFDRITALRYHRAECHASTPVSTDPVAARPYRPLEPAARQALIDALRALPSSGSQDTSATNSTSTGTPSGSSATPTAERACAPASPKISPSRSDAPSTTAG